MNAEKTLSAGYSGEPCPAQECSDDGVATIYPLTEPHL